MAIVMIVTADTDSDSICMHATTVKEAKKAKKYPAGVFIMWLSVDLPVASLDGTLTSALVQTKFCPTVIAALEAGVAASTATLAPSYYYSSASTTDNCTGGSASIIKCICTHTTIVEGEYQGIKSLTFNVSWSDKLGVKLSSYTDFIQTSTFFKDAQLPCKDLTSPVYLTAVSTGSCRTTPDLSIWYKNPNPDAGTCDFLYNDMDHFQDAVTGLCLSKSSASSPKPSPSTSSPPPAKKSPPPAKKG